MDTNDYKGQENGKTDQNNQSQFNPGQYDQNRYNQSQNNQNQYNQYNPYGYGQQPNYQGYYGYYGGSYPGSQNTGGAPKKKGRGALKAIIVILMAICLIGGITLGVVIYPSLSGKTSNLALATDTQKNAAPQASNGNTGGLTTAAPNIGGPAPAIDSSQDQIVQIAKDVGPSVVLVGITENKSSNGYGRQNGQNQEQNPDEFDASGTGIIVSSDATGSWIVTNNHVTTGAATITVLLSDGTEYTATSVGSDVQDDISVIKINATGLAPASFGNSDSLQVGETVVAIGNPTGKGLEGTVTTGIVSALNRKITNDDGFTQNYIQTDAAINPGNSGGPLVNMSGQVVGIVTLKSTFTGVDDYGDPISAEGLGFAIPINTANPVMLQIMTSGSVPRPGIGITCTDSSSPDYPANAPVGVVVITVTEGGSAETAGIKVGDIITIADGKDIKAVEDLLGVLQTHKVGDAISVTVWRSGQTYTASITVGDLNKMSQ